MEEEEAFNAEASGSGSTPITSETQLEESDQAVEAAEKPSKNALRRAARQARLEELRPLKRQAEKIRRRERAHELSQGYADGTLSEADKELFEQRKARGKERRNAVKQSRQERETGELGGKGKGKVWDGGVIMDLGFDELMTDQEINSMASQISYSYSANRLAPVSFAALIHTSASSSSSPRLMEKLSKTACDKWSRCHWLSEDLDAVAANMAAASDESTPLSGLKKGQELVYLSADSEEELTTLKEGEVYIIGGLVDRNRHKHKAERLGIRTARLPIGTYIQNLPTRKVLTVNQVFSILVEYLSRQDWREAFDVVIPPRKFVEKKRKRGKGGSEETGPAGEEEDEASAEEAVLIGEGDGDAAGNVFEGHEIGDEEDGAQLTTRFTLREDAGADEETGMNI